MHNLDFDNNRMVLGTGPLATEASVIRHMHNLDFDNNRMVLGTGPLATEASVIRELSTDTKQRTLFLMSAMRLPPNIGAPGIFPDVLALMEADRRAGGGVTFPQFGYGCISVDHERDIECR